MEKIPIRPISEKVPGGRLLGLLRAPGPGTPAGIGKRQQGIPDIFEEYTEKRERFQEVISDCVVLEAKRHLLATATQVSQIAWDLGYEDVSYFIRFFKRHTAFTPEAFRNKFPRSDRRKFDI